MNFDFSDALKQLRDEARRYLAEHAGAKSARRIIEGGAAYDEALWSGIAAMGWLGANIPEEYGGAGLGPEGLCILAEEVGRALAPIPFSLSAGMATDALLIAGTAQQKAAILPRLAEGTAIGTLAWAEGPGNPRPGAISARFANGRLSGSKVPVPAGHFADFAIVAARADSGFVLVLADLADVRCTRLETLDPSMGQARLDFDNVPAEALEGDGWLTLRMLLDRAAILAAFEQIGGADACLQAAVAYAKERHAFGRPIGSFQAIKHKLADIYIANELARSNAYYGAWALATEAAELPLAAASARVSATEAFHLASKENIQTHGGMGFTWDADCHLFYRRAKHLALTHGSAPHWKDRLVGLLESRNAA